MSFQLENVVPWGRSQNEYQKMFQLDNNDLSKKILDCAGGPSSFNAEITYIGGNIISCDPLYHFQKEQIQNRINETYKQVLQNTIDNQHNFIWESIKRPKELVQLRMSAMNKFLADFNKGKKEGRYLPESLPKLPFNDNEFDLALCSHFLFLYTNILSLEFHKESILEMCRVAKEVRIFPLLDFNNKESEHLSLISNSFNKKFRCKITSVNYEFQKGANKILTISIPE